MRRLNKSRRIAAPREVTPGKSGDLFGILDLVALAGLFNSFRMMRLPEPPASDTLRETTLGLTSRRKRRGPARGSPAVVKIASPVWRSASSMGAGRRRRWMPDMLASSPTCSVEGLMDDVA